MNDPNQNPPPAIPDALAPTEDPAAPELRLGPPFAIAVGADLVDAKGSGGAGCTAIVKCDCSQMFRIDLLSGEAKYCPNCRVQFTHALLIAPHDDTDIVTAAMGVVMEANGFEGPGDDDDDEGDDDDDDDGQGDDEPEYDNGEDRRG